eukprot:TRINITY_DN461_c1_g3_i2.p1 TRINITY_DN461_c1_g3~~TRINITY_DN461_c1_g3_i2.p1  ORF type:complete len:149 (-),score=63.96 TRINITY_DN461_c1_g3_i2:95-541(-)
MTRVYVDMVGDLFHFGHMEFLRKAKEFGSYLIVGLCADDDCAGYKRKPIMNVQERAQSVSGCRWVDQVIPNCPLVITKEFIEQHDIHIVAHGDDFDTEKMRKYYSVPMDMGIFRTLPYTQGVSTSDILLRIKHYWEEKERENQQNQPK